MSSVRWEVLRAHDSFTVAAKGGAPQSLGLVTAPDKFAALDKATTIYGRDVVVRSLLSRECETSLVRTLKPKQVRAPRDLSKFRNPKKRAAS